MARLIQAAINGRLTRAEHPGVPTTPDQQALAAAECVAAGAGAIHLHVRAPDGRESVAAGGVARAVAAMRGAVPGVPFGGSTGAWIVVDSERRLKEGERWTVLPDYASVNFHEDGSRQLAELLHSRGVGIEAGPSHARGGGVLRESGRAPPRPRLLLRPRGPGADAAPRVV